MSSVSVARPAAQTFVLDSCNFLSKWGLRLSTALVAAVIYTQMIYPTHIKIKKMERSYKEMQCQRYLMQEEIKMKEELLKSLKEDPAFVAKVARHELRLNIQAPEEKVGASATVR